MMQATGEVTCDQVDQDVVGDEVEVREVDLARREEVAPDGREAARDLVVELVQQRAQVVAATADVSVCV
jgi:hypothetical protein